MKSLSYTVVSIETTREQLANYFEEYARSIGFDGKQARQFFANNVDFTFSHTEALISEMDQKSN